MSTDEITPITPAAGGGGGGDDVDRRAELGPVTDHTSFSSREIGVDRICINTEPLSEEEKRQRWGPDEQDHNDEWCYLVVTVENRSGAVFEVDRHLVRYDGMIGSSTGNARVIGQVDWRPVIAEDAICPLCHHPGHGAGKCEYRHRWM